MNFTAIRKILPMAAASSLVLGMTAQAQTVEVRVPDNAAELRDNMERSMQAAQAGQRVGMLTGRANPQQERVGRSGAVALELDASTLMYSVARIGANGKLEKVCVSGHEAAEKALTAPAFAARVNLAKEHSDVK